MQAWLTRAGLRFAESGEETAFRSAYCLRNVPLVQVAMFLGALLLYIFFIWDRIIDPINWEIPHAIRGLVLAPLICICAALLWWKTTWRYFEAIVIIPAIGAAIGLSFIYAWLDNGFDYGAIGIVLIILFVLSLLPVRLPYFVLTCVAAWLPFVIFQAVSGNAQPGMMVVNNLSIGTAIILGIFSASMRELNARREFLLAKDLEGSRQRVEDLLHSMLPGEIVERIQAGETAIADAYGEVSIIFADLVGFTELSRKITPHHLIEVLNRLYSEFDLLAERHGIDKIKTIGDTYMAVAGIGRRGDESDTAQCAAEFAFDVQRSVERLSKDLGYPLNIRVGLHIGPVIAGVIGMKRPAFDCWGEAVNLASRLEQSASPGGILVSESACWRLRHLYRVTAIEDIELKGIGLSKVFLLSAPTPADLDMAPPDVDTAEASSKRMGNQP